MFEGLAAGSYQVYFSLATGNQLASLSFNIATGTTDKTDYLFGTPIVVNWGSLGVSGGRVAIVPIAPVFGAIMETVSSATELQLTGIPPWK